MYSKIGLRFKSWKDDGNICYTTPSIHIAFRFSEEHGCVRFMMDRACMCQVHAVCAILHTACNLQCLNEDVHCLRPLMNLQPTGRRIPKQRSGPIAACAKGQPDFHLRYLNWMRVTFTCWRRAWGSGCRGTHPSGRMSTIVGSIRRELLPDLSRPVCNCISNIKTLIDNHQLELMGQCSTKNATHAPV